MMITSRTGNIVAIALTAIALGAVLGGATNAVNGKVSPIYFTTIMGWDYGTHQVYQVSIMQGIFEGLCYGILFSLIFTTIVSIITRASCPYRSAVKALLYITMTVVVCWILGGLSAMGLATLNPEWYRGMFLGVPSSLHPMLGYAWVGGSIWGAEIGALLALIFGSIVFYHQWKAGGHNLSEA